jgi:hypothetical protein
MPCGLVVQLLGRELAVAWRTVRQRRPCTGLWHGEKMGPPACIRAQDYVNGKRPVRVWRLGRSQKDPTFVGWSADRDKALKPRREYSRIAGGPCGPEPEGPQLEFEQALLEFQEILGIPQNPTNLPNRVFGVVEGHGPRNGYSPSSDPNEEDSADGWRT